MSDTAPTQHFLNRWASWAVLFICLFAVIATVYVFVRPKPYDPLVFPLREPVCNNTPVGAVSTGGACPTTPRIPGVAGPAMHLGDPLILDAIECSHEVKPLAVEVEVEYRQIQPPGPPVQFIDSRTHSTTFDLFIPGGCTSLSQPLTTVVLVPATKALFAKGIKQVAWQLSGTIRPKRGHSVRHTFQSDNFVVVP